MVRSKSYKAAVKLALKLEKPRQLLLILKEIHSQASNYDALFAYDNNNNNDNNNDDNQNVLLDIIESLNGDELSRLFVYLRDWNTNAKNAVIAQRVLSYILVTYSAESLAQIPNLADVLLFFFLNSNFF